MLRRLLTILSVLSLLAFIALIAKWAFLPQTPLAAWSVYADTDVHCRCILLVDRQILLGEWHGTPHNQSQASYKASYSHLKAMRDLDEIAAKENPRISAFAKREIDEIDHVLQQLPLEYELGLREARGLHAGISRGLGQCFSAPNASVPLLWHHAGIAYHRDVHSRSSYRKRYVRLAIPIWMIAVPLLILPLWRAFAIMRTMRTIHRRRRGLCHVCAYDLRAHHPGDRCPECGSHVATRPTSAP